MALRLLTVDLPDGASEMAVEALKEAGATSTWKLPGGEFGTQVQAVIGADRTGAALDLLHDRLTLATKFRALVLPLDAVLPRPAASRDEEERVERSTAASVSREEVYANIAGGAKLSPAFVLMAVLATVVAVVGLTRDNTAAVIGAMVVAPLLGPNMALALGLTLGDRDLIRHALRSSLVGVSATFAVSVVLGLMMSIDPAVPELASRTVVGFGDMLLAVAAGAAGAIAYTSGASTYLVGVMVAVAMLPPTVASGLLLGSGHVQESAGAALLLLVNVVAVTFSSMVTFLAAGMRPRAWWKEERARRGAHRALAVLAGLIALLLGIIWLSERVNVGVQ